jgi:hypothetical protein
MMRNIFCVAGLSMLMIGCAPAQFYTNDVANAHAKGRTVSARAINAENKVFALYKVNEENYALLLAFNKSSDAFANLESALILGGKEAEALRETCREIIEAYEKPPGDSLQIVEYHLVGNAVEEHARSSTVVIGSLVSTRAESGLYSRVPLRLQYTFEPGALFGSGKRINYLFDGTTGTMSIEQVQALLKDLQK